MLPVNSILINICLSSEVGLDVTFIVLCQYLQFFCMSLNYTSTSKLFPPLKLQTFLNVVLEVVCMGLAYGCFGFSF